MKLLSVKTLARRGFRVLLKRILQQLAHGSFHPKSQVSSEVPLAVGHGLGSCGLDAGLWDLGSYGIRA